jgi:hypothetical protein
MVTSSLASYRDSSAVVDSLLVLESGYADPPNLQERGYVEGLRGGAIVLLVAAFENYLKESFAEALADINKARPPCQFSKLPTALQAQAVWTGLEYAMKGRPGEVSADKLTRLPNVLDTVRRINNGELIADAVAKTSGNPDSSTVKVIYKYLDYGSPFMKMKPSFDKAWGTPTAQTFIQDTLDTIVGRRHVVAHTASILNTSRADLASWKRFVDTLTAVMDPVLERHVARIIERAQ